MAATTFIYRDPVSSQRGPGFPAAVFADPLFHFRIFIFRNFPRGFFRGTRFGVVGPIHDAAPWGYGGAW